MVADAGPDDALDHIGQLVLVPVEVRLDDHAWRDGVFDHREGAAGLLASDLVVDAKAPMSTSEQSAGSRRN